MTLHDTDYLFDTGSDLGEAQVRFLEILLDAVTTDVLSELVRPGSSCLEIGAGSGSIARWLADRAGPSGHVVAVDLDTSRVEEGNGVEVLRHDINEGPPDGGPFDLIHARLVLLHLPRRVEILQTLVDALAPGGWLVFGEFGSRLPYAVSGPTPGDAEVFDRVMDLGHRVAGVRAGQSLTWAQDVPDHLFAAGMADVHTREHSHSMTGGDTGARYLHNLVTQILPVLAGAGLTETELSRCRELVLDPRFRGWFYQFLITRGRRGPSRS
ncbi:MAG: class I SAM-dependent methyltransferase [Propionibacteriaceae bacterium]